MDGASRKYSEPIAFDYLSRLERGKLMPSVPKLATLANIYQRSLAELVDLYELEHIRSLVSGKGDYQHFRSVGVEALERGDHYRAVSAFLRSLDIARILGNLQMVSSACNNVGLSFMRAARYQASQRYLEEGLRCAQMVRTRCLLLDNLASVHYQLDDLILADYLSEKAIALAGDDPYLRSTTSATRAAVLSDLQRVEEAVELSRNAMLEFREMGNSHAEIREASNFGAYLVKLNKVEEGLAMLREAMGRAAEQGDPHLRAQSALFYGRCLYELGRNEDACPPLKAGLLIARDGKLRKETFHIAFYLWKLARERGSATEVNTYEDIARQYRVDLEQRSEEAKEFDSWLAERRRKARRRTNA